MAIPSPSNGKTGNRFWRSRKKNKQAGFVLLTCGLLSALTTAGLLSFTIPRLLGFYPYPKQAEKTYCSKESKYAPDHLKVMTWNLQFFAGRYYPFWTSGFNKQPLTLEHQNNNLDRIAGIIEQENPDVLIIQELHRGHVTTNYQDQLEDLRKRISHLLPCHAGTPYWYARFIPAAYMAGHNEMHMAVFSRYRLEDATRFSLPDTGRAGAWKPFYPRHALFSVRLPLANGSSLTIINTHLDAPTLKRGNINAQLDKVMDYLGSLTRKNRYWLLGGDLNLLPPGFFSTLPENQKIDYSPQSELTPFYKHFNIAPPAAKICNSEYDQWLTAYDKNTDALDLIVDYLITPSYLPIQNPKVIQSQGLDVSDHMPVVAEIQIPRNQNTGTKKQRITPKLAHRRKLAYNGRLLPESDEK